MKEDEQQVAPSPTAVETKPQEHQNQVTHAWTGGSTASGGAAHSFNVSWENLSYKVGDRVILDNLTGSALPGRTLALMGSSGAGKTTFLNALADRLEEDGKEKILSGPRLWNEVMYERRYRKMLGYVTQDDIVGPYATPQSAFNFALRIRRGFDTARTQQQVEGMLDEMKLTRSRNTIVGIPGLVSGLSGGERKRTNIGVELISDPRIVLLDEPTSGLDSVTSIKIAALLSDLSRRGRTVIFTIHQPTAELLTYIDDLMLMAKGKAVYHGQMQDSVAYFAEIGYPCPETHTPTDFFMTLLQDATIADVLVEKWQVYVKDNKSPQLIAGKQATHEELKDSSTRAFMEQYIAKTGSSLPIQFTELTKRAFHNVFQDKQFIVVLFVQAIFFGIVIGLIFLNLKNNAAGIQDRQGLLFMISANKAFSSIFLMINTFPPEKAVFIREQYSGAYSPFLYFLTKSVAEFPVQVLAVFLEAVIVYWMTGLSPHASNFFYFFAVVLMASQVGQGLGLFISAAVSSHQLATGIAPLLAIPMLLAGGLMASTDRLRPYWYWLEKLSFVRHGFVLLSKNEYESLHDIRCDSDKYGAAYCAVAPKEGSDVLAQLQFTDAQHSEWAMWVSMAVLFVLFRILVVLALNHVARSKQ